MKKHLVTILLFCLLWNNSFAQISSSDKKWKYLVGMYVLFPNLKGETAVRNLPDIQLDAKPGDIFSHLQIGFMMNMEAQTAKWAITSDLFFANLEQDITAGTVIISGKSTARQIGWETSGLYRFASFFEAGIGGRLNSIESGIDLVRSSIDEGTTPMSATLVRTWMDPIIIARLTTNIKDKWLFLLRGDMGGFGIGSKFTWQLQAYAGYHISKLFLISAGYKILSINYDKGTGVDRFRYDTNMFGPVIRFGFNF
jgi:hypothetical protein